MSLQEYLICGIFIIILIILLLTTPKIKSVKNNNNLETQVLLDKLNKKHPEFIKKIKGIEYKDTLEDLIKKWKHYKRFYKIKDEEDPFLYINIDKSKIR